MKHYKQLDRNKFGNLEEMNQFLKNRKEPQLTQYEGANLYIL